MSDFWQTPEGRSAEAVSPAALSLPAFERRFVPWSDKYSDGELSEISGAEARATIDIAQLQADAFAEGFNEGRRTVEMEVAAERQAVAALAETLEQYRPEAPEGLAELLAETVDRLVRQIVGEVVIDAEMLQSRVMHVASVIIDASAPARMRLHPDDLDRLANADMDLDLIADPDLLPGSVIVETGTGWIEDGPEVGIEKLRQALERMSVPQ